MLAEIFTVLFLALLLLLPFTLIGIEFLIRFSRHGEFETRKYRYYRVKKELDK